jgi:hypothetical protein
VTSADGAVLGITKLVDHGAKERRFNVVFLSDGYQGGQLADYGKTIDDAVTALRIITPFRDLWPAVNIFRVDVQSTDSGADNQVTGVTRRTFFDARITGQRRDIRCDERGVHRFCKTQIAEHHIPIVIVNVQGDLGTAANGVATIGAFGSALGRVVAHEIGHVAFGLADEYDEAGDPARFSGARPKEPNVTTTTDPTKVPWRALATLPLTPAVSNPDCSKPSANGGTSPPTAIGLFEGADHAHCGIFRPAGHCLMRDGDRICNVCREEARRGLRSFRPVTSERQRFGHPPGDLLLTALDLPGGPSVLRYDPAGGQAVLWAVAPDASALTPTFSATWHTGVAHLVPLALTARIGLLIYNGQTGRVEIDEVAADGSAITTLWPSQWTTGWSSMTSYSCNGLPFLFSYKDTSGRAAIDHVTGNGIGTTTVFDGTVDAGLTHFVAMERTDPLGQPFRPGGALVVGYRADAGTGIVWFVPDDGSSLNELTRFTTLPFATSMIPQLTRGELVFALYNATSGEVRWVFVGDVGVSATSPVSGIALGITVDELGSTTWSTGWTGFAPFLLGGETHWLGHHPAGTLVIERIS